MCKKCPSWGGGTFFIFGVCVSHLLCPSTKKKGGDVFYINIRESKILKIQVEHILNGIKIEANIPVITCTSKSFQKEVVSNHNYMMDQIASHSCFTLFLMCIDQEMRIPLKSC